MNAKEFLMKYPSQAKVYLKGVDDILLHNMVEQYAEQKAIEFAEWCEKSDYQYHEPFGVWINMFNSKKRITTKELYSLFNSQSK